MARRFLSTLTSTALAAVLLCTALLAPAQAALPIPSGPGELLVPNFVGEPATAAPVESFTVPPNPYMAPPGRNSMHNNAYATDAYTGPGPLGRNIEITTATYGIKECATVTFDTQGRIVALCGGLLSRQLKLIDPVTLDVLATHTLPAPELGGNPLEAVCGGAYFYLDNKDRAVVATTNEQVRVLAHDADSFTELRRYDLAGQLPNGDCLIAVLPDYAGLIWFVTKQGGIGTIAPESGTVRMLRLNGEHITNSFATDADGGVYIVSTEAMYRLHAGRSGEPVIDWRSPYDNGTRKKPGQLAQGSGTTPTLVGDNYVAITDNADPRMHVQFYNRHTGERLCSEPVFPAGKGATANSLVAVGNSVIVENNYGYKSPASTMFGHTTTPGIARVKLTENGCVTLWTSDEVAPTSVPKASLASGLLYVYTKPANPLGIDAWYFTAIDLRTGDTVYKQLTGTGPQWNNHYAAIYLGPDGAAYIATMAGMIRLADQEAARLGAAVASGSQVVLGKAEEGVALE